MSDSYIAFISYRHKPLDTAVAIRLHRMLEHYRIPRELRRDRTAHFGRAFRDQDELPLSSDLTAELRGALERSEFLIVVCSPDTPASPWVDREIEYFLQHHDRSHVLAVLAAGTADQSFPKRLTEVYGEDGVTVIDEAEPLAANISKAANPETLRSRLLPEKHMALLRLKGEFLRLAAALLRCPYDALRQRQKQYLQRRVLLATGAVAAVSVVFTAMLSAKNYEITSKNREIEQQNAEITAQNEEIEKQNAEISRQMREAQINETNALTLLSANLLKEGDRTGALEAAISALPGVGDDRPYSAAAEKALTEALNAYQRNTALYQSCMMSHDLPVEKLLFSDSGTRLITRDEKGALRCFDAANGNLLWESEEKFYAKDFLEIWEEENRICRIGSHDFNLLELSTGKILVRQDLEMYRFTTGEEKDYIPANRLDDYQPAPESQKERLWTSASAVTPDHSRYISLYEPDNKDEMLLAFRNVETGEEYASLVLTYPQAYRGSLETYARADLSLSETGTHWALKVYVSNYSNHTKATAIYIGETASGKLTNTLEFQGDSSSYVLCTFLGEDLMAAHYRDRFNQLVERYSAEDPVPKYSVPMNETFQQHSADETFLFTDDHSNIWWVHGADLCIIDDKDGELDTHMVLPSKVNCHLASDSVRILESNGCTRKFDETYYFYWTEIPEASGNTGLSVACGALSPTGAVGIVPETASNCVAVFQPLQDDDFEQLDDLQYRSSRPYLSYLTANQKYWIIAVSSDTAFLYKTDSSYTKYLFPFFPDKIGGESADGKKVLLQNQWNSAVFSLEKGKYELLEDMLPSSFQEVAYPNCYSSLPLVGRSNIMVCTASWNTPSVVWWEDFENRKEIPLPEGWEISSSRDKKTVSVGNNRYFVIVMTDQEDGNKETLDTFAVYSCREETWGNMIPNPAPEQGWGAFCVADERPWMAYEGNDGICYIIDLETGDTVDALSSEIRGDHTAFLRFADGDRLLVILDENGQIRIFETENGSCVFRDMLKNYQYSEDKSDFDIWLDSESGTLCLLDHVGLMDGVIIDLDSWQIKTVIPHLVYENTDTRQILCRYDKNFFLHPLYTTEELIKQGRALLNNE